MAGDVGTYQERAHYLEYQTHIQAEKTYNVEMTVREVGNWTGDHSLVVGLSDEVVVLSILAIMPNLSLDCGRESFPIIDGILTL